MATAGPAETGRFVIRDRERLHRFSKVQLQAVLLVQTSNFHSACKIRLPRFHIAEQPCVASAPRATNLTLFLLLLPLQDNGPAVGKRPMPHAAGGSPVDSRPALSLQHPQPSRPHASSSADAALPLQLSGLHISPSQRYGARGVGVQRDFSFPLAALCLHPAEDRSLSPRWSLGWCSQSSSQQRGCWVWFMHCWSRGGGRESKNWGLAETRF